jgi:hypothetical protein
MKDSTTVWSGTISAEAQTLNTLEAEMPEADRERLSAVLYEVRKAFVQQWARYEARLFDATEAAQAAAAIRQP